MAILQIPTLDKEIKWEPMEKRHVSSILIHYRNREQRNRIANNVTCSPHCAFPHAHVSASPRQVPTVERADTRCTPSAAVVERKPFCALPKDVASNVKHIPTVQQPGDHDG